MNGHQEAAPSGRRVSGWRALVLCLLVAVFVGCDESPATLPSGVLTDRLSGTWTLVSLQPAGEPEQPTPIPARYTLTFAGERVTTLADCNTCNGTVAVSGTTVSIGPLLACARAACLTQAFASTYVGLLSGESTITRVTGVTLELSSSRGTLRFSR
ncbi:MAG: META domain-containing protein [Acidimicrobiia bacterium]|nr:META domain-containing protein [Acidimicrobiia bacterium]